MQRDDRASKAQKTRLLFLFSNPGDKTRIRIGKELREIEEELERGASGAQYQVKTKHGVQVKDMTRAILDYRPHLIHFSGHANERGELAFENAAGKGEAVLLEGVRDIVRGQQGTLDCVVLNACFTQKQLEELNQYVPYVIGMKAAVNDRDAVRFSTGFYQALAAGCSIPRAYNNGVTQISTRDASGAMQPTLGTNPELAEGLAARWGKGATAIDSDGPGGCRGALDKVHQVAEEFEVERDAKLTGVDSTTVDPRCAEVKQEVSRGKAKGSLEFIGVKRS